MFCVVEDARHGTLPEVLADEFEGVFKRQWPRLVRILYRMTGDRSLSEDLAQESLVRFYRKRERLEKPEAFLHRVVIRLGLDALKSRNVEPGENRPLHDRPSSHQCQTASSSSPSASG